MNVLLAPALGDFCICTTMLYLYIYTSHEEDFNYYTYVKYMNVLLAPALGDFCIWTTMLYLYIYTSHEEDFKYNSPISCTVQTP